MKVLLPIDGSVYSDRAIEYICEHSSLRAKTDTVYLLNVQKKLPSGFASKIPNSEEILDEAAKKILKPAKKALEAAGYKVKMKVAYGKATNRIVEYAQEIPATLIVMGSHGHTPVKGILLGSKTSSVLASTSIPLLVVRHKFYQKPGRTEVGVCLDGSEYSPAVLTFIKRRLPLFAKDARFHLINVASPQNGLLIPEVSAFGAPALSSEEFEKEQREPFFKIAKPFENYMQEKDHEVVEALLTGDPAAQISMYAQEHNLSLMVMGTHGGSSLRIMMLGSVTMSVASQTKLPMLLVHHDDPTLLRDLSKEE